MGKSFIAQHLGYAAVRAGHTVRFVHADAFFRTMAQARVDHSTDKTFRSLLCHSFIIVMSSNPHSHAAGPGLLLRELADREHVFDDLQVRIRAVREPYLAPLITGDDVVDGLVADNDLGL